MKPQLDPTAEAFVPSFGSNLASWAQRLQAPSKQAPDGPTTARKQATVIGSSKGTEPWKRSDASTNQAQQKPPGKDASRILPTAESEFSNSRRRPPNGNSSSQDTCAPRGSDRLRRQIATGSIRNQVGKMPSGDGKIVGGAWSQGLASTQQAFRATAPMPCGNERPATEKSEESWAASATRRAIGSDSGDLEFDDLFASGGGGGGSTDSRGATPPSFGGSCGGGALEHSLSSQGPAFAKAADLDSALSLEAALATGGMLATSYVELPLGAPISPPEAAFSSPVTGTCLAHSVLRPPVDVAPTAAPSQAGMASDMAPATPSAQMVTGDVPMSPSRVSPGDFQVMKVVGQGAFGKVFQVRKKDTGRVYAMKVMRKAKILARDHGEYVRAERDVLTSVRHPYIVMLNWSFQTSTKLYLVMDFVNGGHLFFNLYRAGIFDESQARLYTAEIVAAIAHLHSLHIVHRDLKPENVLLDGEGHVRVTDFGLAKNVPEGGRSNSLIGTMEYMAPEVINARGHNKGVDWWSIGILLYEMVCGITPFRSKDKNSLKKMITQQKLKFTKSADGYLSQPAKALIRALLEKDPIKRLGGGADGSAAVKNHPFFRSINWAALEQRQVPSPYCPKTSGIDCVQNFDKLWTDRTPEDSPVGSPSSIPMGNSFRGFTYVAPSFLSSALANSPNFLEKE